MVKQPPKPLPATEQKIVELPQQSKEVDIIPEQTAQIQENPEKSDFVQQNPEETKEVPETPEATDPNTELPLPYDPENTVFVNNKPVEIKPTKLKYFRNKTASAYGILKVVPLTEFLTYGKGVLDPKRDADQMLYDFLIAVFDDPEFVRDNYDDMTAETVERAIKIFGRINGVDEKEEAARKNREAQAQKH